MQEYLLTAETQKRKAMTHAAIVYMECVRPFVL